jgi:hypothetical protein
MLKIIEIDPSYYNDEPLIKVLDTSGTKALIKSAADSRVTEFLSQLKPEPNRVYLHIIAMGASDYWGKNLNADIYLDQDLRKHYKTFETNPAHVFRNHVNKRSEIAMGEVVLAFYNERMHRVELCAWVDKDKAADLLEKLEAGETIATSMACRTPSDACSVCGNRAKTRQMYCSHLKNDLGKIYPDGTQVGAVNDDTLSFFDISWIMNGRQADKSSTVLQKVASEQRVVGGAELAEIYGLSEKSASMRKLSEFVKEITGGEIVGHSSNIEDIVNKIQDPDSRSLQQLAQFDLKDVLVGLANLGISPSLEWLTELIAIKSLGFDKGTGLGKLAVKYTHDAGSNSLVINDESFGDADEPNIHVLKLLAPFVKQASLFPDYVTMRAVQYGDRTFGPGTNVGYIGNGPRIEETPQERYERTHVVAPEENHELGFGNFLRNLSILVSAAMAAKWFITDVIKKKSQDESNYLPNSYQPVKILPVEKRASFKSAYHVAESIIAKDIRSIKNVT